MTGSPVLDSILFFFSVLGATAISLAEFAITSASRSLLEHRSAEGNLAAARALELLAEDENLQATVRIAGITCIIIGTVVILPYIEKWALLLTTSSTQEWLPSLLHPALLVVMVLLVAGVFLVFSVLVAKSLGTRYADALALRPAGFMKWLTTVLHVPQRMLTFTANILLKPFRGEASFHEEVVSEEQLREIIQEGARSGLVDETEHELIESIFQFTDTTAREVMIPRTDIVAIEQSMSSAEVLKIVLEEGFTRMPVYRGSLDHVVGVIYAKDIISLLEHKNLIVLDDIIRPAFTVPETKLISELLREFQYKRIHLAVVVDEFGGTEGIITMEDVLEEIVGEIRDEYDDEIEMFRVQPDGSVEVEGMVSISDLNSRLGRSIPESDEYDTLGGFVTSLFGRIPDEGDSITDDDIDIDVLEMDEHRVKRVRLYFHTGDREEADAGQ